MAFLPLQKKKIVITRAEEQSKEFINRVLELGGEPISLPLIAFKPAATSILDRQRLKNLTTYNWLVFTSVNGIDYLFKLLEVENITIDFTSIKIAVVGSKTQEALESKGISATVKPSEFVAEGLVQALEDYKLKDERILYIKGNLSRGVIPEQLRLMGAIVDELIAYETYCPTSVDTLKELMNQPIDVITFTSPSTINNLTGLVKEEEWKTWISQAVICCIGPITKAAAEKAGITPTIVPVTYTMDAILKEIVLFFNPKEEPFHEFRSS